MATKSADSAVVAMSKVKTTKGAVMFLADDESMPITNIYFRKDTLAKLGIDEETEKITVTVQKVS